MFRLPQDQRDSGVGGFCTIQEVTDPGVLRLFCCLHRYQVYSSCRNTCGLLGFSVTVETQATKFRWLWCHFNVRSGPVSSTSSLTFPPHVVLAAPSWWSRRSRSSWSTSASACPA